MTDRICIASNGTKNVHISAEDMNSCCDSCGFGCDGGYPGAAWQYWQDTGIVDGANYKIQPSGCYPYSIANCDHHLNTTGKYGPWYTSSIYLSIHSLEVLNVNLIQMNVSQSSNSRYPRLHKQVCGWQDMGNSQEQSITRLLTWKVIDMISSTYKHNHRGHLMIRRSVPSIASKCDGWFPFYNVRI
jgi:hypothetical protein